MQDSVLFRNIEKSGDNVCFKLYNDKITLCNYRTVGKSPYKWVNPRYKVDLRSGEMIEHTVDDAKRVERNFKSSLARSLRTIYEISDKNVFGYFLTVTFNKVYVNRKSAIECYRAFRNVIKRLKYAYGQMEYLAVGEFHWDSSIHFHVMCNFLERQPKLRYRGTTPKGNPYYTILDDFKKEDCFLTVEKLHTNNTDYLVKYFTKSGEFPLARRFMCSRNLKRSRAVTKVLLFVDEFQSMYKEVGELGFKTKYRNNYRVSLALEEEHTDAPAAGGASVDLFNKDIKDEKRIDIQAVWDLLMTKLRNQREIWKKIYKIQCGDYVLPPKAVPVQLAFDLV